MTYDEWEQRVGLSPSSPESYYAEKAWKAALGDYKEPTIECKECKYFDGYPDVPHLGECGFRFPTGAVDGEAGRPVRVDDSCDLWAAR
jgi:hypothetical protein